MNAPRQAASQGGQGRALDSICAPFESLGVTRFGMRYIDRLVGAEFSRLPELVYPDVGGLAVGDLSTDLAAVTTEAMLSLAELNALLRLRWALVPAGLSYDPAAIPPVPEPRSVSEYSDSLLAPSG